MNVFKDRKNTNLLITLYQQHPCIWDIFSEKHKLRDVKEDAWKNIFSEFNKVKPGLKNLN